ncbi:uncharacterized protein LOC127289364 [Leptopilina boulardi]|uniref:uncharacterized protein LOC127278359 n=1 Tax=Leptopilina boulardi TaxID=63433 RepID=UPI0021F54D92|nr:uncharacterized protein LOC127278359 [Leptopilina boulardi]XP_051173215.1 uncharacterized protein LOC127289364 [Leptopilina boulardi]
MPDSCLEMAEEYSHIERDIFRLKKLLTDTRETRKRDSRTLTAQDLLNKYPALHDQNLFLWEFEKLVDMPIKEMRSNLKINASKETVPASNKAPTLISVDEHCEMLKCYVDSEPLHCAKPLEALLLLIASYYIFNINYEKKHNLQFLFLERIIFGEKFRRISPINSKYLSLLNLQDRAKLGF